MSRRASSKLNPLWIVLFVVVLLFAGGGGYFLYQGVNNPYRALQPLDMVSYLEDAKSLRGNVYKIEGTVYQSLAWKPTKGRLFSVEVTTARGSEMIAVLIPANFNHLNVQKGQRYNFKIEIIEGGVIQVQDMSKV